MYRFEIHVQARPDSVVIGGARDLDGRVCKVLPAGALRSPIPMPVSFEEVADRLQRLPRLFFEPDGSFVWVGHRGESRWQVDGLLSDRDGRVLYAELKGHCPPEAFDQLLRAMGWPATRLVFQFIRHGVFVDEGEFRRLAAGANDGPEQR